MRRDQGIESANQSLHPQLRNEEYPPFFFASIDDRGLPLRSYLRIIWNRRWIILAVALVLVLAVGIRTIRQKPIYNAVGTLEIEMPKQSITNIQDFFPSAIVPDNYLQTQSKILSSGQLIRQVVDKLNPSNTLRLTSSESRWTQQVKLQKRLDVQVLKGSQLIQVTFQDEDPELAAKVVNQLMSFYIGQIQEQRSETANDASGWLLNQLKESKTKLDESMETLQHFEREHQLLLVNTDRERIMNIDGERLQQLQEELAHIENTRMEKEAIYQRVRAGDRQMLQSSLLDENMKKEAGLETELAQLSGKFGLKFPQVQRTQAELAEVRAILALERERLSREIEAVYQSAVEQEALIHGEIAAQREKVNGGSDQLIQDNVLKRDVDLNRQSYESLMQKLQDATITASLKTVSARIVDPAEPPAVSSHPGLVRNLALSLMIGLTMGICAAVGEELMRDTIKSASEVESSLNLPLLGIVPAVSKFKMLMGPHVRQNGNRMRGQVLGSNGKPASGEWFRLDRDSANHYELAESIRNLRTSLLFALDGKGHQAILVSSSVPSEGKTTISANISISLTQLGKKVLLIDGDLRRPCLHRVFSILERVGLSEYLQGVCRWEDIVYRTSVPGLDVIVCGQVPQNPVEILSSGRMEQIIAQAKLQYDIVIIDSPTLLNMADSRILASFADGVVIIIKSRATPKLLAKQACANVRGADATIVGVVLNHLEVGDSEYSYSNYGYPDTANSPGREEVRAAHG